MRALLAALLLCLAGGARAQDSRPDESALFGAPGSTSTAADVAHDAFARGDAVDNPLQLGGLYYQRWIMSKQLGSSPRHAPTSMPLQFDAFMDARPSDRVRGYVQGRLLYDPTRDRFGNTTNGSGQGDLQFASTSGAPQTLSTAAAQSPSNPQGVLDQAWLKFDIERAVFVTAGKQHVKWGVSRFWNPTDFLSTQRRDPLLPYDLRLGNTMVKFDVPLQRKGSNLYGIVLVDNPQPGSTLGQTGVAFRAETVVGGAEVGFDAVGRGDSYPVYGADVSAPAGPFDVYAEAALSPRSSTPRASLVALPTPGADVSTLYSESSPRGPFWQVSGGANYTFGWRENRRATAGAEYFYNELGYDSARVYPVLILLGRYQPFYAGRHYAGVYVSAEGPDEAKHTNYTLTTLGNLSDGSYLARVDFTWRFLTYLTFEAYADDHFGTRGGEFRFALNTPALTFRGTAIPAAEIPPTVYDVGMGLRLSF